MQSANIVALMVRFKYPILIPIAAVEGPIIMMLCGLWTRLGYIEFLPAFIFLTIGDLLGDIGWYWLGRRYGARFVRRFGKYFSITYEHIETVRDIFHRHKSWILLFSKMTGGFGLAITTLFTAGMIEIPFFFYLMFNFLGQLVWTGLLMSIGYFLGSTYLLANDLYGKISVIAMALVIILLFAGFARFVRHSFKERIL